MAYMDLNVKVAATNVLFGLANTKVRVRVKDGATQILPTIRAIGKNLPEGEQLRPIARKGNASRIGLPTAFTDTLKPGVVAFVPAKHGWFTMVQGTQAAFAPEEYKGNLTAK